MDIMKILEPIFYAVITTATPILVAYVRSYLISKKEQIDRKIENDMLQKYVDMAIDTVESSILAVSQTYVDSLKKSGTFDENAQKEAKMLAIDTATALITKEAKVAIEMAYGDFNKWLDTNIESLINQNK